MWPKIFALSPLTLNIKNIVSVFDEPKQAKDKYRSLEIVVVNNKRKHVLGFDNAHFDTGCWFEHFQKNQIAPGQYGTCIVANARSSVLTGVSGGMSFNILDTQQKLGLGFCNPTYGNYKTEIMVHFGPDVAKDVYTISKNDNPKHYVFPQYTLDCLIKHSKVAQKQLLYVVTDH